MATLAVKQLQLAPLGAGDLIDRTVRLYRRHFGALVRASAPPVVVSAVGTVLWSVSVRSLGATTSEARLALYLLAALAGACVYVLGLLAQLIVMGGASRNLVMHLLWGEPVTARLIYRSVRSRFWSLLGASLLVSLWLFVSAILAGVVFFIVLMIVFFALAAAIAAASVAGVEWVPIVVGVLLYLVCLFVTLYVFFLLASRVAYVPQVLMVEGKGVIESVNRSVELARGNVRRLMGMFLFTLFASYSVPMLLFTLLGWVGYLSGINPFEFDASRLPAWYSVAQTVIGQASTIVLAPVWMMGMSLLYVDERVRHEGYDVELLAAQRFGEMPAVPTGMHAPLAPALASSQETEASHKRTEDKFPGSMLGLN